MLPLLSVTAGWMIFAQTFSQERLKTLEAREVAISSGYCKFTVKGLNTLVPTESRYSRVYEVWFSGNKIREDVFHRDGPMNGARQITCIGCDQMDLSMKSIFPKSPSILLERIKGELPRDSKPSDPRKMGYVFKDYYGYRLARLDALFQLPGAGEPTVTQVNLDGLDCLRFALGECSNGWKQTIWTAPSQGNNIVKIEVVSPSFVGFVRSDLA